MAASAWTIFDSAKHKMATSQMPLSGGVFRISLHKTSASALLSNQGITIFTSLGDQCSGGGYVARTLSGVAWTAGASAAQQKWDVSDPVITASASVLSAVRYAVVRLSNGSTVSGFLLAYAALSTAEFNVTTGNTLTIQLAATGVFTLT